MRGSISGGMLAAMHDMGLLKAFDCVYGSSAGAINAAYFVAAQPEGVRIYYSDLANSSFFDVRRLFSSEDKPALSVDYLLDDVVGGTRVTSRGPHDNSLKWQRVLRSPVSLKTVTSSLSKGRSVVLDKFATKADLIVALKASSKIPVLAGQPVMVGKEKLADALLFEPIPIKSALNDRCTHLLILLTRPDRAKLRSNVPAIWDWPWIRDRLPAEARTLRPQFQSSEEYNAERAWLRFSTLFPEHAASLLSDQKHASHSITHHQPQPPRSASRIATIYSDIFAVQSPLHEEPPTYPPPQSMSTTVGGSRAGGSGPYMYAVSVPYGSRQVNQLEMNTTRLKEAIALGYSTMVETVRHSAIGGVVDVKQLRLSPFDLR